MAINTYIPGKDTVFDQLEDNIESNIKTTYLITHPYYGQESRLPENKQDLWANNRLSEVSGILDDFVADENAYLIFYTSGLEPEEIRNRLTTLPEERSHIIQGPNDYNLSDKKLMLQEISPFVNMKVFGAYVGACLRETTETVMNFMYNEKSIKVNKLEVLGGDIMCGTDYENFRNAISPLCQSIKTPTMGD